MRRIGLIVVSGFLALALSSPAIARDRDDVSPLTLMSYSLSGGGITPAGQEGQGLDPGPHVGASARYESHAGIVLGGAVSYNHSNDRLRTHVVVLEAIGRLSPPAYDLAYVQIGAGVGVLGYDPKSLSRQAPASTTKLAGSFGIGAEFLKRSKMSLGASITYHGIAISRTDALSFLVFAFDFTFRPSEL